MHKSSGGIGQEELGDAQTMHGKWEKMKNEGSVRGSGSCYNAAIRGLEEVDP